MTWVQRTAVGGLEIWERNTRQYKSHGGEIDFQWLAPHPHQLISFVMIKSIPFTHKYQKGKFSCSPISNCCADCAHCMPVQLISGPTTCGHIVLSLSQHRKFQCNFKKLMINVIFFSKPHPLLGTRPSHTPAQWTQYWVFIGPVLPGAHKAAVKAVLIWRPLDVWTCFESGQRSLSHAALMFEVPKQLYQSPQHNVIIFKRSH